MKRYKKIILTAAAILFSFFILLLVFVNRFIEPILKDRLHTLIIQGSDSLYSYTLGKLTANFYGGNVEVENLQIRVDSNRYEYLREHNALPSLTMQLSLKSGRIKGVGIIDLLFEKKIHIEEILSSQAHVQLTRHVRLHENVSKEKIPVWKAIQPAIKSIYVGKIKLEGIRLHYKNVDTSEAVKLEFSSCDALFKDIQIDSTSAADTSRMGFTKSIFMKFNDIKFRTEDSSYKMKAKQLTYSSDKRTLEVDSFKLQPTLEKEEFYKRATHQQSLYYIEFEKVRFVNTRLDHFLHNNIIDADSVLFEKPEVNIYNDKSLPATYDDKIGKYPHQVLLNAGSTIIVKNVLAKNAEFLYTEKDDKTQQEGSVSFSNVLFYANNVTNDSITIKQKNICTAQFIGELLKASPFNVSFKFYLDSDNGRYDANGVVKNISAAQLNPIAEPLANVYINSFFIHSLDFNLKGEDYNATATVKMLYNNLALTFRKTDDETGQTQTKKFLTKVVNKYVLWPNNPGSNGVERAAQNKFVARLTTDSFFALLWKTIFAGMEDIMMKSGG